MTPDPTAIKKRKLTHRSRVYVITGRFREPGLDAAQMFRTTLGKAKRIKRALDNEPSFDGYCLITQHRPHRHADPK